MARKGQRTEYKPHPRVKKTGPDPVDVAVGKNMRSIRLQHQKSQEWVAAQLNLTFQQVQKYEKGTNRIAPSRLQKLADIFNIPVTAFFPNKDQDAREFTSAGSLMTGTPDGVYIASNWAKLTPQQQKLVKLVVGVLAQDAKVKGFTLNS